MNTREEKMRNMPLVKLIISMSLPPVCSMFLQYTYNFVDSIFVAQISEEALTAVSLSFPITALMLSISIWLGVGINVVVARNLGSSYMEEADKNSTIGLVFSVIFGSILTILGILILEPYFNFFAKNKNVYELCMSYMKICAFMQLPNMVHIAIQKIIQATGNMVSPMWFQIAGVVFNFIFDPILIFGIGPFPEMGIGGAALSTVLGYTLSMLLAFYMLFFRKQKVKIVFSNFKFEIKRLKDILILGLPSFVMNVLSSVMLIFTNNLLLSYDEICLAFFGMYFKIQQMIIMTLNGLIQGCLPIMSFNYGAKNYLRLNKTYTYASKIAFVLMLFSALILMIFPSQILTLFKASEQMKEIGITALRVLSVIFIFAGLSQIIATYLQAIGKVKLSFIINFSRQLLLLFPIMLVMEKLFGINGVWFAFPTAEVLTFIIAVYFKKISDK